MDFAKSQANETKSIMKLQILGLIYLPLSFASVSVLPHKTSSQRANSNCHQSIFGMEFFNFQPSQTQTKEFTVSSKFWIFIIVAGILLLITSLGMLGGKPWLGVLQPLIARFDVLKGTPWSNPRRARREAV